MTDTYNNSNKRKKTRQLKQKLCEAHFGLLQSFLVHNGTKVDLKLHSNLIAQNNRRLDFELLEAKKVSPIAVMPEGEKFWDCQ